MEGKPFKYRGTLQGHTADVRSLSTFSAPNAPDLMLSTSRDKTTRLWEQNSLTSKYEERECFLGHTKFVSCVAAIYPVNENYPNGLIVTGSNDRIINVYAPGSSKAIMMLAGHTDTVCCLAVGENGIVVSGSWDKTARVWKLNFTNETMSQQCLVTMSGHDAAVWDVLYRSHDEVVVTASADKTIKTFKSGSFTNTFTGHTDCVRGLSWLTDDTFLSCSNDACVKRWSLSSGRCLDTYYGHRNFVYSVSVLPGSTEFVTSSEDRTIRLWSVEKQTTTQTIALPSQSPWSITTMQNGDLAVGCSDATIRVFTRNPNLMASDEEAHDFEMELSKCEISKKANDLGDIDLKSLPTREVLSKPGKSEGQTIMVKNEDKVEAYQWSSGDERWIKVGDVIGSSAGSADGKTTYKGKEYDYVFSVDIEEGKPPLKLPFNLTEEPWMAAQRFIDDNNLSQSFLETIANFIMDNTKDRMPASQDQPMDTSQYRDPFTGSGGYIPGSGNTDQSVAGGIDPFTGGGRHIPSAAEEKKNIGNVVVQDPMIAPDRYVPGNDNVQAGQVTAPPTNPFFPKSDYITFTTANINAMLGKIEENSRKSARELSGDEMQSISQFLQSSSKPSNEQLELVWDMLHWPLEILFPVMDLVRVMAMRHTDALITSFFTPDRAHETLSIILRSIHSSDDQQLSKERSTCRLVALRCLCNLLAAQRSHDLVIENQAGIVEALDRPLEDKNSQTAVGSLLVNLVAMLNERKDDARCEAMRIELIRLVNNHLSSGVLTDEACFRTLVALGGLLSLDQVAQICAKSLHLGGQLDVIKSRHEKVDKIDQCLGHLQLLLK